MTDSEYESSKKWNEEKVQKSIFGMYAALSLIEFNDNRARRGIELVIERMLRKKSYNSRRSKRDLLVKKLGNQSKAYIPSNDVEKSVNETAKRFLVGKNESVVKSVASTIYNNGAAEALLSFASEYIEAMSRLEYNEKTRAKEAKEEEYRKRQEEKAKAENERREAKAEAENEKIKARAEAAYKSQKAKEEAERKRREAKEEAEREQYVSSDETPSYTDRPSPSSYGHEPISYTTRPSTSPSYPKIDTTPGKTQPKPGPNDAVSTEYIQREIDVRIQRGDKELDSTLLEQIQKTYKKLDKVESYGKFYSDENINKIYEFYILSKKREKNPAITFRYDNIVRMGDLAVDIIFNDLMDEPAEATKMDKFMDQFNPFSILWEYEESYNAYIKYYDKLTDIQKRTIDDYAERWNEFNNYRNKFGISAKTGRGVATVDDIIKVVNKMVRSEYVNKRLYSYYCNDTNEVRYEIIDKFFHSLKYMSITDIAILYKEIKNRNNNNDASLQKLFALAIRDRLNNISYTPVELNDVAKRQEIHKKEEIDLVAICKDYFQEEPRFELSQIKSGDVKKGYGEARVKTSEAIDEAELRYFGMGKLQQVFGILDFRKLRKLGKKDILTPEELAEVNRMF